MNFGQTQTLSSQRDGLYPLYLTASFFILVSYGWRLWLLKAWLFDPDEFEHLHGAWLIFKGLLPYRDYFEIHTPLFHFLLAPFFHFFDVETKVGDTFAFLFLGRQFMWFLTGVILLLTFWLGKLWLGARIASVGTLFLVNTEMFLTTLQIRPDLLAVACWLGCLLLVVRAVRSDNRTLTQWQFACSGALLGAGIMATQKVLFVLPGLTTAMVWYILDPRAHGTHRFRLQNVGYQAAGFCASTAITLVYFYVNNSLVEFLYYNFAFTFMYKGRLSSYLHYFPGLIYNNPYLIFFGSAGLIRLLRSILKRDSFVRGDFIIVPSTLGLIGGLFLIPVAYPQYYLLFLPLVALLAGAFLIESMDKLVELRDRIPLWRWISLVTLCSLVILMGLGLVSIGTGSHWPPFLVTGYWFTALVGAIVLLSVRSRTLALTFFLVALSVPPLKRLYDGPGWYNTAQLDEIRYVIEHTTPTDTIMDGFTGTGVFRPHAYFYFMLQWEIRIMLPDKERHELLKKLNSGIIAPELIVFDNDLRAVSPGISAFFEQHYQPVGKGALWRRKKQI